MRRLIPLLLIVLALTSCVLPARNPVAGDPEVATLTLTEAADTYTFDFAVRAGGDSAVCVLGRDMSQTCPTLTVVGRNLAVDHPDCTLVDSATVRCIFADRVTNTFSVPVTADQRPVGVVGFYLASNLTQPYYIDAR